MNIIESNNAKLTSAKDGDTIYLIQTEEANNGGRGYDPSSFRLNTFWDTRTEAEDALSSLKETYPKAFIVEEVYAS